MPARIPTVPQRSRCAHAGLRATGGASRCKARRDVEVRPEIGTRIEPEVRDEFGRRSLEGEATAHRVGGIDAIWPEDH